MTNLKVITITKDVRKTEMKCSTYDRELLAVFRGVKHFRHMLEGKSFYIETDHNPLVYAFQQKLDKAAPRQIRQLDFSGQFTTDIRHISGSDNVVADALSRINILSESNKITIV